MREIVQLVTSAAIGTVFGWQATVLTMGARVNAIESSLTRIELRLDAVIQPTKKASTQ
jgi:hypothetical protein